MKKSILSATLSTLGVAFFILGFSGCQLIDDIKCSTANICDSSEKEIISTEDLYIFITPSSDASLSPLTLEPSIRSRLINVYEGLVHTDENFGINPSLAISWGRLSDVEWEFRIRKDVKFHNGKILNIDDIIYSFNEALKNPNSEVKGLLSSIQEVKKSDEDRIRIITNAPDPLLLEKISNVYIVPKDSDTSSLPAGTGRYKIKENNQKNLTLEYFKNHWEGQTPYILNANFVSEDNRRRVVTENDCTIFNNSEDSICGIIADIPEIKIDNTHEDLDEYRFSKLNSIYLVFNYNGSSFPDEELQQDLINTVDQEKVSEVMGVLTYPATQYFSSGTFGHDPEITLPETQEIQRKKYLLRENPPELTIDHLPGNELLIEYLKEKWEPLGIKIISNALSPEEIEKRAKEGISDLYLSSWQVANGDAGEFLNEVAHSPDDHQKYGNYNWNSYRVLELNEIIEKADREMNWEERLSLLREASKKTLEGNPIGIPLLEGRTVYAVNNKLNFIPRADGMMEIFTLTSKE